MRCPFPPRPAPSFGSTNAGDLGGGVRLLRAAGHGVLPGNVGVGTASCALRNLDAW